MHLMALRCEGHGDHPDMYAEGIPQLIDLILFQKRVLDLPAHTCESSDRASWAQALLVLLDVREEFLEEMPAVEHREIDLGDSDGLVSASVELVHLGES